MAQITIQPVRVYVVSWHRRPDGAEWDICPTCTHRIGLEANHITYPASTPEKAIEQAYEDVGGDLGYYCPECGRPVTTWHLIPESIEVDAEIEHATCKIF